MISSRFIALIFLVGGWAVFMTPQDFPRRWVKNWTRGYSFAFWVSKVTALVFIVLGATGLTLGK